MADDADLGPTVLRAPGLVLRLDAAGTVIAAGSASSPAVTWLAVAGELTVTTRDGVVELGPPEVSVDACGLIDHALAAKASDHRPVLAVLQVPAPPVRPA